MPALQPKVEALSCPYEHWRCGREAEGGPFISKSNKWTKKFASFLFEISQFIVFIIDKRKRRQCMCHTLLSCIQRVVKCWTSQDVWEKKSTKKETRERRLCGRKVFHILKVGGIWILGNTEQPDTHNSFTVLTQKSLVLEEILCICVNDFHFLLESQWQKWTSLMF